MKKSIIIAVISFLTINCWAQPKPAIQKADSLFFLSDYKSAIAIYEIELKSSPANAQAWNRLGYCYHNLKNYNEALNCYKKSDQNSPALAMKPHLYSRMARIYSIKNDKEKSFESLTKANSAGYVNLDELNTNPDFTNIRNDIRFSKAVEATSENAFPCLKDPKMREFDFWVGDWDVFLTQDLNQRVGHNIITIQPGGCSLLESWDAVGVPNQGQSINFYDPTDGKWQQLWVGSGGQGNHIGKFYDGVRQGNAMVFSWEASGFAKQKALGRFTFTELQPGKVTQHQEYSVDEGKTWQTVYNFTYIKKPEALKKEK